MDEDRQEKKQEIDVQDNQRKIFEWRRSSEWRAARELLTEKLILLDSCSAMGDNLSNEQAGEQARVNKKVFKLICDWISEIEGEADSYESIFSEMKEKKKDNSIYREVDE